MKSKLTIGLVVVLVLLVMGLWSLFISGPVRIHEQQETAMLAKMEAKVKGIEGLTSHQFAYLTFNGYTKSKLVWFDAKGNIITERKIETLNYDKVSKWVKKKYGFTPETIGLGYGYDNPAYIIQHHKTLIVVDYDTYVLVYKGGWL